MSLAEVMWMRQQNVVGALGEQVAAEYLERAGSRILNRNCRRAVGGVLRSPAGDFTIEHGRGVG